MAKNQSDVLTAATGYLKGKIVDDTTIVSEALNNDIVQFFVKLMNLAGLTPNGLYDNETNNYQFIQALVAYVKSATFQASYTERGVAEVATSAEAQAQTDNTRMITPLILAQVTATETRPGLVEKATIAEAQAFVADKFIDGDRLSRVVGGVLTKIVEIGEWNMDYSATEFVDHGLTYSKIVAVNIIVRNDADTVRIPLNCSPNTTYTETSFNILSTQIRMDRKDSGYFDGVDFNDTSINRGWVIIHYLP